MNGNYGIWLSWNNQKEGFSLPVLPGEIGQTISGDGSEHDVSGLGKINVIKDRGLARYQIESFFPDCICNDYPFITASRVFKPKQYVDYIMHWWETKRPIRLVIVTKTMEVNTPVSIESFEWKEVAGSPGDIEYSLSLKEYRFYEARRLPVDRNASTVPTRPDERIQPKTYTLAPGDSLWKVAQKMLGDGSRWRDIQKLNGITDAEIRRLPVGKVLKLP